MSKAETQIDLNQSIEEQLNDYHNNARYKLAFRITITSTVIFAFLTYSFYGETYGDFLTTVIGLGICLCSLIWLVTTKKFLPVFWLMSWAGVLLTSYSLFTFHSSSHYSDFVWIFSSIILGFFGINKKIGLIQLAFGLASIVIFSFFFANENIMQIEGLDLKKQITLAFELLGALGSGMYVLYLLVDHHDFSVNLIRKSHTTLKTQFDVIEAKNLENETLIKEVHHRVKNNLQIITSLLRMQSSDLEDETSKKHFEEAIKRVMTMSLIHQKLYQNKELAQLDFETYLDSLTQELTQFVEEDQMKITSNIEVEMVGLKTIVPLGLLINELVSNSIKYVIPQRGFANIFISLNYHIGGEFKLTYQDNGTWEEENDLSENESTGFGTELINILTEQMEGRKELTKGVSNSKYEFYIKNLDVHE